MKNIAEKFAIEGTVSDVRPLGNGLINDTYLVSTASADTPDYVLQRINHAIFTDVDALQRNIVIVTDELRRQLTERGVTDLDRRVLRFLPLVADPEKTYFFDGENYWRMSVFIPDSFTREEVTPKSALQAGRAFGEFQAMLTGIADQLTETIPDFHNMEFRLLQFNEAIETDAAGRVAECRPLIDALLSRADRMTLAERRYRDGVLPKRVCHCDTKVNNMLFDADGNVLCVIDLDTVMPSFIFSDFGDFLRTGACTSAEDEPDLSKVGFDINIFHAFAEGYLQSAHSFLNVIEVDMLTWSAELFPYMQAVRFLTDYLNGDTYYKIAYPDHNLVRTRAQLRMLESVEAARPAMADIISSLTFLYPPTFNFD